MIPSHHETETDPFNQPIFLIDHFNIICDHFKVISNHFKTVKVIALKLYIIHQFKIVSDYFKVICD